jgi:short chain dehydrogenase
MRVKIASGAKFIYLFICLYDYTNFGGNGSDKQKGRLQGKVAIVTGAGTGIGEAIAHKFAKERASTIVCGLPDDPIEDVAKAISNGWRRSGRFRRRYFRGTFGQGMRRSCCQKI